VKTPLIYDKSLWETSGHWEKFRENMFLIAGDEEHLRAQADELPGHMLLFGSQLRSYRELPLRYAEAAPLHRNELAGAARAHARPARDAGRRAHLLHARADRGRARRLLDYLAYLYDLFGDRAARRALDAPDNKLGTTRSGTSRRAARDGARAARDRVLRRRGRGRVLRAEDRPPHATTRSALVADGTIQLDAQMPARFGLTLHGRRQPEHTLVVIHRALLGSLERFIGILIEHYGGAFPSWLAPVQVRVLPVADTHRDGRARSSRRSASARCAPTSTSETRRSASGSATPSSRRSPTSVVWGDRETRDAIAVRARGGQGVTAMSLEELVAEIAEDAPS
jgi:threonyl-tRNA synthetase